MALYDLRFFWNQPGGWRVSLYPHEFRRGWLMPKLIIVCAAAAGLGLAALAATDIRPDGKMVADLGHSLAAGVILGSSVWPYALSPVPPGLQSRRLLGAPDCDDGGQCGMYGLASTTFVNSGDGDTAD
jgi:hypothetical protein